MGIRDWAKAADWVCVGVVGACGLLVLAALLLATFGETRLDESKRVDTVLFNLVPSPVKRYFLER